MTRVISKYAVIASLLMWAAHNIEWGHNTEGIYVNGEPGYVTYAHFGCIEFLSIGSKNSPTRHEINCFTWRPHYHKTVLLEF